MPTRILRSDAPGFRRAFERLRSTRTADQRSAESVAAEIVAAVRRRGDAALFAYTKRFDGVALTARTVRVPDGDLAAAEAELPGRVRSALRLAARRIRVFHEHQRQASWRYRDAAGLELGQNITPLRRVGVYVPGGHAAYPSSVLMNVIPARVAGVEEVIMVSPAGRDGHVPAVLAAAHIAGATAVYRIGGAQAVAALAYGTKTIGRVDKIVGPGNAFVQAAKRQVYGQVDIDSTAGPSEVVVIADTSADPAFVASDLLAQAEHGSGDESALLFTPSARLAAAVQRAIETQLAALPRRAAIARVLAKRGALIVVRNLDEAVALAEEVAPEHLGLLVRNPGALSRRLRNAGAIFEGPWAPVPLGDYLAGPNHTLPTGGSARFFSPLGTYHFVKRTSVVRGSRAALQRLGPSVVTLAMLEGYQAHAAAIEVRLKTPSTRTPGHEAEK
ncbi:MAG: histidinol dehydrogenase [bacterium]